MHHTPRRQVNILVSEIFCDWLILIIRERREEENSQQAKEGRKSEDCDIESGRIIVRKRLESQKTALSVSICSIID